MILLSYDGSTDAKAAIDRLGQLMPGAEAEVLTVWEPFIEVLARSGALSIGVGMGMAGAYVDAEAVDAASREGGEANAAEGAERARAAGLSATARAECGHGAVADTILSVAAEIDADVVVMGTRGLSGVRSFLLGSVSRAVVEHADLPVLVVPSAALAARRRTLANHAVLPA